MQVGGVELTNCRPIAVSPAARQSRMSRGHMHVWQPRSILVTIAFCAVDRRKSGRRGTVAEERPDLIAQWDSEQNGPQTPQNTTGGSPYKAMWRCGKACKDCGSPHEGWRAAVVDRCKLQSTGCPFCRCSAQAAIPLTCLVVDKVQSVSG